MQKKSKQQKQSLQDMTDLAGELPAFVLGQQSSTSTIEKLKKQVDQQQQRNFQQRQLLSEKIEGLQRQLAEMQNRQNCQTQRYKMELNKKDSQINSIEFKTMNIQGDIEYYGSKRKNEEEKNSDVKYSVNKKRMEIKKFEDQKEKFQRIQNQLIEEAIAWEEDTVEVIFNLGLELQEQERKNYRARRGWYEYSKDMVRRFQEEKQQNKYFEEEKQEIAELEAQLSGLRKVEKDKRRPIVRANRTVVKENYVPVEKTNRMLDLETERVKLLDLIRREEEQLKVMIKVKDRDIGQWQQKVGEMLREYQRVRI